MQSTSVECPLCFKNFSFKNIERHVENCGEEAENVFNSNSSIKRKRTSNDKVSSVQGQRSPSEKSDIKIPTTKQECQSSKASGKESAVISFNNIGIKQSFLKPLAEIARPACINDYVGQANIMGDGTVLKKLICDNNIPSMVFWGPPGCGKTTLAHIIANSLKVENAKTASRFVKLSATNSGKADVQASIKVAMNEKRLFQRKTILFIDEIHRFNKLQQDTFLPHVENGTITLLGATTENPSFALNAALLSRCRVIVLEKLNADHIMTILYKAINSCLSKTVIIDEDSKETSEKYDCNVLKIHRSALKALANMADGDARTALNGLQLAVQSVDKSNSNVSISVELVKQSLQHTHLLYDKNGDQHFQMISALQKSIRGGDDNASLYWLTRMLLGGEDPRYIARRLIRIASEDIGLADPNALTQAVSCYQACINVGMPECDVCLAQCVTYLARAPKSIEVYTALERAKKSIQEHDGPLPGVPLHLRNGSTTLMKKLGYGEGYKHQPDNEDQQTYMPDRMQAINFFE